MTISSFEKLETKNVKGDANFEYARKMLIPYDKVKGCIVAFYELKPGKSNYPYHYHTVNEEVFYIISGTGTLKTPEGDKTVKSGDIIHFPADETGAHRLTNSSETENLVYIDFDTHKTPEVCIYPDSNKVGVYGAHTAIYKLDSEVEYYEGEK